MKALTPVPEDYLKPTTNGGTVVRVDYTTIARNNENEKISKYAYVYLPYGYDSAKKYDIIYCLHGGGGELEVFFGTAEKPGEVKLTLDSMIANGDIPPVIAVSPTYYSNRKIHGLSMATAEIEHFCKNELANDLIPAIEGTYSTYADTVDQEGLRVSRDHRAFAGFSLGALSTWYTFIHCLDCFRYFMPMSGDCWVDGQSNAQAAAQLLENAFRNSGYREEDFFIYAVTGDKDVAYERMKNQLEAMKSYACFPFITDSSPKGNLCFCVEPEAAHDYKYMPLYFYNGLTTFWKTNPSVQKKRETDKLSKNKPEDKISMPTFLMKPKIDFAFKEIMMNEDARIGFLSAVLKLNPADIKETQILNAYLRKVHEKDKLGILDVRVRMNNNTEIDIEINLSELAVWADRSLFYLSKMYTEQISAGQDYSVFKKCVSISILDFTLFKDDPNFYSCFHLREDTRGTIYTDKMEFHVIELPKLPEELKDGNRDIFLWAKFINAEKEEEFDMLATENSYIKSAYKTLQVISQDDEKRVEYEAREKAIRDYNQGMLEATTRGWEAGERAGREEGLKEGKKTIARNMLAMGLSVEVVSKATGLSAEEVEKLPN